MQRRLYARRAIAILRLAAGNAIFDLMARDFHDAQARPAAPAQTGSLRVLLISNGHGEDSIGADLVRRLPGTIACEAYPTLGAGRAYEGVCAVVGPRRFLPSEGLRRRGTLLKDARAGFGIGAALRFMRRDARRYNAIVVVGDMLGVIMCWLSGRRVRVYLDVYKSGYANRYSALERYVLRRTCDLVLTRDERLAEQLRDAGVPAGFAGNAMMDTLVTGQFDARGRRRHAKAIAILPGSRKSCVQNFALQVAALRQVPDVADIDLFAVLATGADVAEMAAASGLAFIGEGEGPDSLGTLAGDGLTIHLAKGSLGAVIEACDIVLGQAGTANLQAIGMGRPVVSFLAEGARPARVRRVAAMLGESRITVGPDAAVLGAAIARLLADDADRARRGAIGRERIGGGGAFAALAEIRLTDAERQRG